MRRLLVLGALLSTIIWTGTADAAAIPFSVAVAPWEVIFSSQTLTLGEHLKSGHT
jgi:hypothetical protein